MDAISKRLLIIVLAVIAWIICIIIPMLVFLGLDAATIIELVKKL